MADDPRVNRLLGALPELDWHRVRHQLEPVTLELHCSMTAVSSMSVRAPSPFISAITLGSINRYAAKPVSRPSTMRLVSWRSRPL